MIDAELKNYETVITGRLRRSHDLARSSFAFGESVFQSAKASEKAGYRRCGIRGREVRECGEVVVLGASLIHGLCIRPEGR